MKTVSARSIPEARVVESPDGAFESFRLLLQSDSMGFGVHETHIMKGGPYKWHYKNHLEACYCISGRGFLRALDTGVVHEITPGVMYVLDENDRHSLEATTSMVLLSVFNPPCHGQEVHREDGSYVLEGAQHVGA
jgi:L-ectoine synthase